jgi:hypothetical protein
VKGKRYKVSTRARNEPAAVAHLRRFEQKLKGVNLRQLSYEDHVAPAMASAKSQRQRGAVLLALYRFLRKEKGLSLAEDPVHGLLTLVLEPAKRLLAHGSFATGHKGRGGTAYNRAIRAACAAVKRPDGGVGIPVFTPGMLRHSVATLR